MKKEDKAIIIAHIGEQLAQYSAVYLVQTSGLNAEKTSKLRRACFGATAFYREECVCHLERGPG